jgi:hypothetical protein
VPIARGIGTFLLVQRMRLYAAEWEGKEYADDDGADYGVAVVCFPLRIASALYYFILLLYTMML